MTRIDLINKNGLSSRQQSIDAQSYSTQKTKVTGVLGDTNVLIRHHNRISCECIKDVVDNLFKLYSGYIQEKDNKELLSMSDLPSRESIEVWSLNMTTRLEQWREVSCISRGKERGYRFIKTSNGYNIKVALSQNMYVVRDCQEIFTDTTNIKNGDMLPSIRKFPSSKMHIESINIIDWLISYDRLFVKLREDVTMEMLDEFISIPRKIRYHIINKPMRVNVASYVESGMFRSSLDLAETIDAGKPVGRIPVKMQLTDDLLSFLGHYSACGRSDGRTVVFKLTNKESVLAVGGLLKRFDLSLVKIKNVRFHYGINSSTLAIFLRSICGDNRTNNRLVKFWTQLDDKKLGVLLQGFFACYANFESNQLYTRVDNDGIGSDLQYALTRLGIKSRILTKYAKNPKGQPIRLLSIKINGRSNLLAFHKYIGFNIKKKRDLLENLINRESLPESTLVDFVPMPVNYLPKFREKLKLSKLQMCRMSKSPRGYTALIEDRGLIPLYTFSYNFVKSMRKMNIDDVILNDELDYVSRLNKYTWSPVDTVYMVRTNNMIYDFSIDKGDAFLAGSGGFFLRSRKF